MPYYYITKKQLNDLFFAIATTYNITEGFTIKDIPNIINPDLVTITFQLGEGTEENFFWNNTIDPILAYEAGNEGEINKILYQPEIFTLPPIYDEEPTYYLNPSRVTVQIPKNSQIFLSSGNNWNIVINGVTYPEGVYTISQNTEIQWSLI